MRLASCCSTLRLPRLLLCLRPADYELAYLTDVEGNLGYFERWVEASRCVAYTGERERENPGERVGWAGGRGGREL